MQLQDGLVLRQADPRELAQIGELLTLQGEADDAVDHRLVVDDPDGGLQRCAVVVDGDRVVSTLTLLDEQIRFGPVVLTAGQVELVATHPDYEGRGLVRSLMDWAHQRSAVAGHVIQVMVGIPYFYRLFGYRYAIDIAQTRPLEAHPRSADAPSADVTVRPATETDIAALDALHDRERAHVDLAMGHSPMVWRSVVARNGSSLWVAERDGRLVAGTRTCEHDDGVRASEVVAVDADVLHSLLVAAGATHVTERPNTPTGELIEPLLGPRSTAADKYYVRIPDPIVLLDALRPVFAERLAGRDDTDIVLSFFGSHVRLAWRDGQLGEPVAGGAMQSPGAVGGAGIAPDHLADLLFGSAGITGLMTQHPDIYPGPNVELMTALFPPVSTDIMTFYLT